jgi:CRP-like cAMP-binding protein
MASVVALTPMTLLRLDRSGFEAFLRFSDRVRAEVEAAAARRATETRRASEGGG